jgi:hypothetical protein
MRRRIVICSVAIAVSSAQAQDPRESSPRARCETDADTLLGALGESHYDAATADFNDALRTRYPSAKLKQDYESLPASYGKALGVGRPHSAEIDGRTVVMTPLIFERGTLTVEVHCDAQGRIADLKLLPTQTMQKP